MNGTALVVSCEHASCAIPDCWKAQFPDLDTLASHKGWDAGAAAVARALASHLGAPCHLARVSRLLVDCNRSAHHPQVFGAQLRTLPPEQRRALLARWHTPYREAVATSVERVLADHDHCLHLSCHSFTPVLAGRERNADIGLLYDPGHGDESRLAAAWQKAVQISGMRVRRNYPYRGTSDGLTRTLRQRFGPAYAGIELELNQSLLRHDRFPPDLCKLLQHTLAILLAD